MMKRVFSLVLAMLLLLGCAAAEETALGNLTNRGVILDLTQADVDMGIEVLTSMEVLEADGEEINVPTIIFLYSSPENTETAYALLDEIYETGNFDNYEAVVTEYNARRYLCAAVFLVADEKCAAALGEVFVDLTTIGENDGYTYMLTNAFDVTVHEKDDPAVVEAAGVRVDEILKNIQYQPVVIPEEEFAAEPETVVPNAFPAFTTQDLNGNTVDNSIFANADLTVLNIWGTTCYPCISEMPELQAWSEEMPENVQIIGLAGDVTASSADSIETAQMICEATGVTFTNLVYCADMAEFMTGIIFTPTTVFVDRNGAIVGEPIVGAVVDEYKAFVEEYLAK